MGEGARRAQMENRFGLGQPVDTYGEPCPYAKAATQVKEIVQNKEINEAQAQIFWKQAIKEAIQDSNLKALAGTAGDMGDLKSYYETGELSLVLKGKIAEGKNLRVTIRPNLIKAIMDEEGPIQVAIIDPATSETYGFYKDLHEVKNPSIEIPKDMVNDFQSHQEVVVKIKQLPVWNFLGQLEGKASEVIRFNKDGVLVANLSSKEIPIESFEFDYSKGETYVEFQVKDITGMVRWFGLYDNGFGEPRFTIKMGRDFDTIEGINYDPKRDSLKIEYNHHMDKNRITNLRFMEPPDEIDLVTRRIPEEMRLRWEEAIKLDKKDKMGEIGAEVAAKITEKEYNVKVILSGNKTGPDSIITLNNEPAVFEAKSTKNMSMLVRNFRDAEKQVKRRDKAGIAVSVYIEKETGFFECKHKYVPGPSSKVNRYEGEEP